MSEIDDKIMRILSKPIIEPINDGGHVFENGSDPIYKEDILITIEKFLDEMRQLFPGVSKAFDSVETLGSTGKKEISGDIDLAISDEYLALNSLWPFGLDKIDGLFMKFKKRARTATDTQIYNKTMVTLISEYINHNSKYIVASDKGAGNGTLFCQFPQYSEDEKHNVIYNGKRVQIDVNFGNVDWLKFAYYSDESHTGNVKGLHRTQLMLHLFSYKGYVFNHKVGVKERATNKYVATTPIEAINLLNDLYKNDCPIYGGLDLSRDILANYDRLQLHLRSHLDEKILEGVYNIYIKTLDSTRCDIPEDLQIYWIKNQERLGLIGKFLPETSRLKEFATI